MTGHHFECSGPSGFHGRHRHRGRGRKERVLHTRVSERLAEDIRRYLAHQPITARPPTLGYQIGRFVRRNKAVVAGATTAVLALVIGLVLAVFAQREEARQRVIAEEQTAESRAAA